MRAESELDTVAGLRLLEELAAAEPPPKVVLTGGDPLMREDLFWLIARGRSLGLSMSVSPSATPLLDRDAIIRLKSAGVDAISLSIDGSTAARHDGIRGVPGTFERTLEVARVAAEVGLLFQVNTLVSKETLDDIPAIEALARSLGAARFSLFFLVTVGRGSVLEAITPEQSDQLLSWLAERSREPGMILTTTEAPFFTRVVAEKHIVRRGGGHTAGIRDGNGVMFIAHDGEVFPSGFLPVGAGNVKNENPLDIYRHASLFRVLRDVDSFEGRCGVCEFRGACGGSRARAYMASGDVRAEDPLCTHAV